MQIDPVGYSDDMNLYAYVGNSPLNGKDPSGRTVESVTVDKNKNVHIIVAFSFKGDVTPKMAAELTSSVVNAYSGKKGEYTVNVTVVPESQAKLPNIITVKNGEGLAEGVGVGMREYTIYTKDPAGAPMKKVMQHEAGHAFGLDEQYSRSTNLPYKGKENDIMGSSKNGVVTEQNIIDIIKHFAEFKR